MKYEQFIQLAPVNKHIEAYNRLEVILSGAQKWLNPLYKGISAVGYIHQDDDKKLTLVREPLQFIYDHIQPENFQAYLDLLSCGDISYEISREELDGYIDIITKIHNKYIKTDRHRLTVEQLFFKSHYGPYEVGDIDYAVKRPMFYSVIVPEEYILGYLTHCILKDCEVKDIYSVFDEIEEKIDSFRKKCFGFTITED